MRTILLALVFFTTVAVADDYRVIIQKQIDQLDADVASHRATTDPTALAEENAKLKSALRDMTSQRDALVQQLASGSAAYQQLYASYTAAMQRLGASPVTSNYDAARAARDREADESARQNTQMQQALALDRINRELHRQNMMRR